MRSEEHVGNQEAENQVVGMTADQRVAAALLEHRQRLWRLVHFRMPAALRDRVDVEDVLQEVYLDAQSRAEHFPTDGTDYLWLRLVTLQTMTNLHRRHVQSQKRSVEREARRAGGTGGETSVSIVHRLLAHLTSPSQAAMRQELSKRLRQAVDELDALDAEVLALRHFEELSNQDVARVLEISEKAASNRYIRALRRLKDLLAQIPGFDLHAFGT
jgi:RNA polymerase sigma-70 factor (ECF subfamily)